MKPKHIMPMVVMAIMVISSIIVLADSDYSDAETITDYPTINLSYDIGDGDSSLHAVIRAQQSDSLRAGTCTLVSGNLPTGMTFQEVVNRGPQGSNKYQCNVYFRLDGTATEKGTFTFVVRGSIYNILSDPPIASVDCTVTVTVTGYTVTFNSNGGDNVSPQTVAPGTQINLPTTDKIDNVFDGWFTELNGGTKVGDAGDPYTVNNDVTLYAHWHRPGTINTTISISEYVDYDDENDYLVYSVENQHSVQIGSCQFVSGNIPAGMNFYDSSKGGTGLWGSYYFLTQFKLTGTPTQPGTYVFTVRGTINYDGINPSSSVDCTVTVTVEYRYFTVTFNANGGTVDPSSQSIRAKTQTTLPTATKSNYSLDGWFTELNGGTKVGDAGDPYTVNNDVTLYAHWSPVYTVTFNANGGTVSPSTKSVVYGREYGTLPTPIREEYAFVGWYTASSGGNEITNSSIYSTSGNQTLYAHWLQGGNVTPTYSSIAATLNFVSKGSYYTDTYAEHKYVNWQLDIWTERTLTYGATINVSETLGTMATSFNYQSSWFNGINVADSFQRNPTINNAGITISYGFDNVSGSYKYINVTGTGKNITGDFAQSNTYTSGYQNNRWMVLTSDGISNEVRNFITIVVHVQPLTYTLTYDTNGGTFNNTPQTSFNENTTVTLATDIVKQDYTFLGWQNGQGQFVTQVTMNSDIRVHAVWQYNYTTLTYDTNGGTFSDTPETVYLRGTIVTLDNNIARTGYSFGGWKLGNNIVTQVEMNINRTVIAQWTANTYTVTFNANGGTVSPATKTVTYDSQYGDLSMPSYPGNNFQGWYTDPTDGTLVSGTTIYRTVGDQTLYAHWTEDVTYWSNGNPNGSLSILYHIDNTTVNNDLVTKFPLYVYDETIEDQYETEINESFVATGYYLNIEVKSVPAGVNNYDSQVIASLYDSDDNLITSGLYDFGKWGSYIIKVDTINGIVSYTRVMQFRSFTDYQESTSDTILSYGSMGDFTNNVTQVIKITPLTDTVPRQQVIQTDVFLNTYGVVLRNPSLDIAQYFPEMEKIRLNFYSFALYGSSITINGHTMDVTAPNITVYYTSSGNGNFIADGPGNNVIEKSIELTNIFVTWDGTNCYLTFANDNLMINMGAYTNKLVSMEGMWYFATGLFEPYTATETEYTTDWSLSSFNLSTFGIILVALLIIGAIITKVTVGGHTLDYVIIITASIIALVIAGGLVNA